MNDEFKNVPQSITELRADKEHNGSLWTPRDAIISLLREIDNGLKIDMVIIGYRFENNNDTVSYQFSQSTPNMLTAIGLWELTGELLKDKNDT